MGMDFNLLLLLTACMANASLLQFGSMIKCTQPDVNAFIYYNYGCWCGFGGTGAPVDEVDRCCNVHDDCYYYCRTSPDCRPVVDFPYFKVYDFSCTDGQVSCPASNDGCQACVCACDHAAASCFAQA